MMLVTQFICWLVFVSTKISAALVNNNIDSNGDYGMVKGLALMKDPADFRFSKFLDIRFDVDNHLPFDTENMLLSRTDRDPKGIHENLNNQDGLNADNNYNKYLLKKLDVLTHQIQNVTEMMIQINGEMAGIRKNISRLSENQMSIHEDIRSGRFSKYKSVHGVTYNGVYSRIQPGSAKDNQTVNIPRGCKEVQDQGNNVSGVFQIQPKLSPKPFLVLCDMETRGGGWTHIQKRFDGSEDFYMGWREYKFGFGDLDGEFWLGLENIHFLTSVGAELLIDMVDIEQKPSYAHYGTFKIGPETDGYPLSILTNFDGDAGDSLKYHVGQKFSTKDYDQDQHSENCADKYLGAWWYVECYESNLNGKYINSKHSGAQGPYWNTRINKDGYSLSKIRMLVR